MQHAVQRLGREQHVRGQSGICCVRNLIDVVADPPQLGEQCWLHPLNGRAGNLDLSIQHHVQEVAAELHASSPCGGYETRMLVIRYTDVDLPMTLLRRVRLRAGHVTPHQVWVRGAHCALTGKGSEGKSGTALPCRDEKGFASKSTSRYPSALRYVLRSLQFHSLLQLVPT